MGFLQILILLFALFVIVRVSFKYSKHDISAKEWLGWTLFWILAGVAAVLPKTTDLLASTLGLQTGRGVDLAVYISIPALFYLIFRLMAKIDMLQEDITNIVRHVGMEQAEKHKQAHNE